MRERIQTRIDELQSELDMGKRRMQDLELEQARLGEVMLRITGALQVLRELLDAEAPATNGAVGVEHDRELAATGDRAAVIAADAVIG